MTFTILNFFYKGLVTTFLEIDQQNPWSHANPYEKYVDLS